MRILIYSHDTYGLGHLRRSLRIARSIVERSPAASVLVVTGSPRAGAFEIPPRVDLVKLPAVTKTASGRYRPRSLPVGLAATVELRAALIAATCSAYRPHTVLIDHAPVGMGGELTALFEALESMRPRPRMVLGLRDVIDDAARVRSAWNAGGVWNALRDVYDEILVYGDERVATTAQELRLAERLPGKVTHVGYVTRPRLRLAADNPSPAPTLVATAGGGGDGYRIMDAYTSYLEAGKAAHRSVVVTGPFLSRARRGRIESRLGALSDPVDVVRFTDRFEDLVATARGVVSMAGYNTVAELMALGVPALVVPRRRPRLEQWIRARRLGPRAGFRVVAPERLHPETIAEFAEHALATPPRTVKVSLDGADVAAGRILEQGTAVTLRTVRHA